MKKNTEAPNKAIKLSVSVGSPWLLSVLLTWVSPEEGNRKYPSSDDDDDNDCFMTV